MKRKLLFGLVLTPFLVSVAILFLPRKSDTIVVRSNVSSAEIEPEKLVFLLQYIRSDYGNAVHRQEILDEFEYQEMLDFSSTAIDWYETLRPENKGKLTHQRLQELQSQVRQKADWSQIRQLSGDLIRDLQKELSVLAYPRGSVDLAEGEQLYINSCAVCHGELGGGNGPAAKDLTPRPSDFQDSEYMNTVTPHKFFNAITYGVEGTAMPSYRDAFSEQQSWNVAFYLMLLRRDFSPHRPQSEIEKLSAVQLASASNADLVANLKTRYPECDEATLTAAVDYFRLNPPSVSRKERLDMAHQMLSKSLAAYKNGEAQRAYQLSLDAYLQGIEPLEPLLLQEDKKLVKEMEREFGKYRDAVRTGSPVSKVEAHYHDLNKNLVEAHVALEPSELQWGFVAIQSLGIILREGVEASLLIALMITYLATTGYQGLKKYVVAGAVSGIVVGICTWFAAQFFMTITPFQQEAMEGVSSLLAAGVLFSLSFWIIHKVDLKKWKSFIRAQAEKALGTGSGFALAFAAFLAVFREAFETVLFYQVLVLKNAGMHSSIIGGFVVGAAALLLIVILIFKIGMRLPLKPFFTASGILFGLLAFVFAGYGVRELQNIGLLNQTMLPFDFSLQFFEVHPTLEGLALQFGILTSFCLGWFAMLVNKLQTAGKPELNPATASAN